MEGRPKRQTSNKVDYRIRKLPVRETKLTIVHQQRASPSSNTNDDSEVDLMDIDTETNVQETCLQLLDAVNHLQDPEDGTYLNHLFLELPSKKLYPDYYDVIEHPIALQNITAKTNKNEYTTLDDLKNDLQLMVANAKQYNIEESQVYQDALKIQKLINSWTPKTPGNKKRKASYTSSTKATLKKNLLKIPTGSLTSKKNNNSNDITAPDKQIHTIRLKTGLSKSSEMELLMAAIEQLDSKGALDILTKNPLMDVNQLVKVNLFGDTFTWGPLHAACYYGLSDVCQMLLSRGADVELNDTWYSATPLGWAAYGDHERLAQLLIDKHSANKGAKNIHDQVPFDLVPDQDDPKWNGVFYMDFSANRNTTTPKVPTSRYQPVQHHDPNKKRRGRPPKSEIESKRAAQRPIHDVDLTIFDASSFMVDIFNSIRKNTDNTHRTYSELFEELPNREEYPDYYKVIKNPISLAMIEDKMRANSYKTIQEWFDDFVLVFENAMEYNESGSRIYKDGKLLLRMLYRVKEKLVFDYGVPETQEPALMALDLTNRSFDVSNLRSKRYPARPPDHSNRSHNAHRPHLPPHMNPTSIQQHHQPQLQQRHPLYPQYHQPQPQLSQHQTPQQLLPHSQYLRDQRQPYMGSPSLPFQMMAGQAASFTNPNVTPPQIPMMNQATFNPLQQQQQQYPQAAIPMGFSGMMMNGTNLALNQPTMPMTPPLPPHIPTQMSRQPPIMPSPPQQPLQLSPLAQAQAQTSSPSPAANLPNGTPPHQAYFNLMAAQQLNHPPAIVAKTVQEQLPIHSMPTYAKAEFMDYINQDSNQVRLLDSLELSSDDQGFMMNLDGKQVGHSLVIPSPITTLQLTPKLPTALMQERARVTIQVVHNTNNLTPQQHQQQAFPHWLAGLSRGMNIFKLIVMVNATTPTSSQPDYRTQTYHIFVNYAC